MRVAIDIGGTFTDVLLYDNQSGDLWSAKVPSTPTDPARAFFDGLENVLKKAGRQIQNLDAVTHGTTIVTNALLEGSTAKVGMLVTEGFRDLLEIGRQVRPELYDLTADRLPPLVLRKRTFEVHERIGAHGTEITPLNERQAASLLETLANDGVQSLAIVLLFSFLNPIHEERLRVLACRYFPKESIFLSNRVSPEFREYERASTTVVAAAVAPLMVSYLTSIDKQFKQRGWRKDTFSLMHSGGGLLTAEQAAQRPQTLIESGPAAGVIATAELARETGMKRVIAFDMGGTTAKASLILDGKPQFTNTYEVGGGIHRTGRGLGKGYPVRFPMLDLAECGAGAGSLATIDPGGHLKVGPQSAGADPGPVCYGRGGIQPTLTDAYLTLGLLSPDGFLGGEMPLDPSAAAESIESRIAKPLGLTLQEAASGILEIANANMLRILRLVSVQRGYDPRDFSLVAYGGAGPLHASTLAEQMQIRQVVIPRLPAVFSALGLLLANPSADFAHTIMLPLDPTTLPELQAALHTLTRQAGDWFKSMATPVQERGLSTRADLRYMHQNYELPIEIPSAELAQETIAYLYESFHAAHKQAYGHCAPGETIQVVNLRVEACHRMEEPELLAFRSQKPDVGNDPNFETRDVWLGSSCQTCSVYQRANLRPGQHLSGPLIVQERDTTVFAGSGWRLSLDAWGNLILANPE